MLEGERLILRLPTKDDERKILKMVKEFKNNLETTIQGLSNIESCESYEEWLNKIVAHKKKKHFQKAEFYQKPLYQSERKIIRSLV